SNILKNKNNYTISPFWALFVEKKFHIYHLGIVSQHNKNEENRNNSKTIVRKIVNCLIIR
ncbi:MAG: hypothetical protein IJ794_14745, partial [Lachnospiraceae bacterium]|nr:hypothetical protein [Lachnospiraceae bacterium]